MSINIQKITLANGRATLYLGDCLELLKAGLLKCDAIVSDPPYGINFSGYRGGSGDFIKGSKNSRVIHGDDQPFDPSPWIED